MEEFENDYVKYWFENGVLMNELKKPTHVTLEVMTELIETRHQFSSYKPQYWCMDSGNIVSVNKEARDYAAKYGQDFIHASAVLVRSHLTKAIFNAFLVLKKPEIPFLLFTKKEKAIEWLLEIKAQNEQG
ncbi:DUF7793 family protein [Flavobacterium gawalongense]|uniref:DUF7793 domain-containing protein n=1 Tax=Flavobacterium gawalongense TaxID=2594432 RepID=A0ABY3CMP7_9FLAO|nr:hypothetical protein [Flavobacterium gawalongense]TRX02384.1 hypothetical protein FNW33_06120 [Flavobacterium gawalongense]TRX07787.1 hypothetical protein FNW12_05860 [Flavobacterium gawalongense]